MPDTRESGSTVSRCSRISALSEHGVNAIPSFRTGASAESQGNKGGRVREQVRRLLNRSLPSTLPGQSNGGLHMPLSTNAVITAENAVWLVSHFTLHFEEGNL